MKLNINRNYLPILCSAFAFQIFHFSIWTPKVAKCKSTLKTYLHQRKGKSYVAEVIKNQCHQLSYSYILTLPRNRLHWLCKIFHPPSLGQVGEEYLRERYKWLITYLSFSGLFITLFFLSFSNIISESIEGFLAWSRCITEFNTIV